MAYRFPPDVEQLVKDRMASGDYASEDDVLRDAMEALEQLEHDKLIRWNERNQLAIDQNRQGLSMPLDDDKVIGRLRESLAKEGIV